MTATLRKWATDLMVGAGIALLGLVLLAGSGTALGVTPTPGGEDGATLCPGNGTGGCLDAGSDCNLPNNEKGKCDPSRNCPCKKQ